MTRGPPYTTKWIRGYALFRSLLARFADGYSLGNFLSVWEMSTDTDRSSRLVALLLLPAAAPSMLPRRAKALFYALAGPAMKINGALYRTFRAPGSGTVLVQLGPGKRNYLPGWLNVDANTFTARCDVWADLRNPLPFRTGTVDAIYSHHVIEHLPNIAFHWREMHRVLKPGGVFRVGGPHGDNAIRKFIEGDTAWFSDFPDRRQSIGGRFENFIFCRREHVTILTVSWLGELAHAAGFDDLATHPPGRSGFDVFAPTLALETETTPDCPHTLIVEGRKPWAEYGAPAAR
jgi:predicted SAM-dependent methyltransferase